MYIKRYGIFFNCQLVMSKIGTLAVLIILITGCNACPRRTPSQPRPTTSKLALPNNMSVIIFTW